jgi:hypothetical protein
MSRDIYTKVCNGDSISDAKIAQAIEDYRAAQTALFKLGPPFEITRKAVTMTLITLEGFKQARARK